MRIIYKMSCKHCHYTYYVDVIDKKYEWELCNVCGHGAPFDEFNDGELKRYDCNCGFGENGSQHM